MLYFTDILKTGLETYITKCQHFGWEVCKYLYSFVLFYSLKNILKIKIIKKIKI